MKAMALVVLFLAVGAVGCDDTPLSPSEIVDITWKLESVSRVGSPLVNVPNPDQFTVRFETNDNRRSTGRLQFVLRQLHPGRFVAVVRSARLHPASPVRCPVSTRSIPAALEDVTWIAVSGDQLVDDRHRTSPCGSGINGVPTAHRSSPIFTGRRLGRSASDRRRGLPDRRCRPILRTGRRMM